MVGWWAILIDVLILAALLIAVSMVISRLRYEWAAMRTPALRSRPRVYFEVGSAFGMAVFVCRLDVVRRGGAPVRMEQDSQPERMGRNAGINMSQMRQMGS